MNSSQYDINMDLFIELNRYYILKTFHDRLKINEMGKILPNFYNANIQVIYENRSFNLKNIINNQYSPKELEKSQDYLINLLSNFTNHI